MKSKRSQEGYSFLDNRNGPAIASVLIPGLEATPAVAAGQVVEMVILCCSHCHKEMYGRPDRLRPREHCSGCSHYICDDCGAIRKIDGQCRSLAVLFEKMREQGAIELNIKEV